jgi:hypothetical protein
MQYIFRNGETICVTVISCSIPLELLIFSENVCPESSTRARRGNGWIRIATRSPPKIITIVRLPTNCLHLYYTCSSHLYLLTPSTTRLILCRWRRRRHLLIIHQYIRDILFRHISAYWLSISLLRWYLYLRERALSMR